MTGSPTGWKFWRVQFPPGLLLQDLEQTTTSQKIKKGVQIMYYENLSNVYGWLESQPTKRGALENANIKGAAEILIQHFQLFTDREIVLDNTEANGNEEFDEEVLKMRQLLKTKLVDMDLSVRALNCLKSAEVETLGELVVFNKTDLLKFRNFGKKSLSELEELLASLNLHFGMDITKYKLEKE